MSRWALTFPAFHPQKPDERWNVGVHADRLQKIKRSGLLTPLARISLIPNLVANPDKIVRGWNRVDHDECFVYTGHPEYDRISERVTVPPPPRMSFYVFILDDGTIDHWDWRLASAPDALPDGMNGDILWPPPK